VTDLVFTTKHGSRLYGLATGESDEDTFTVTTSRHTKARQSVTIMPDGRVIDTVRVGLEVFLHRVFEGSHQSVEALFSPYKMWGDSAAAIQYHHYLGGMRVTGRAVFEKYERTIKTFCYGDYKRRRHAVRLSLNLRDLRYEGRFNPVMTPFMIDYATDLASNYEGEELWKHLTS
jgi:hypothetical protein